VGRVLSLGVALAAWLGGGGAHAQGPAPTPTVSMMLACAGTVPERRKITGEVSNSDNSSTATVESTTWIQTPAQMSVAVKDGTVRVRPGPGLAPLFHRSPDGWYDLAEVAIGETAIDGKAPYGGILGKPKLHIDRRTGDVAYGSFRGGCEKTSDQPDARKF
jgi:hypothetical protein